MLLECRQIGLRIQDRPILLEEVCRHILLNHQVLRHHIHRAVQITRDQPPAQATVQQVRCIRLHHRAIHRQVLITVRPRLNTIQHLRITRQRVQLIRLPLRAIVQQQRIMWQVRLHIHQQVPAIVQRVLIAQHLLHTVPHHRATARLLPVTPLRVHHIPPHRLRTVQVPRITHLLRPAIHRHRQITVQRVQNIHRRRQAIRQRAQAMQQDHLNTHQGLPHTVLRLLCTRPHLRATVQQVLTIRHHHQNTRPRVQHTVPLRPRAMLGVQRIHQICQLTRPGNQNIHQRHPITVQRAQNIHLLRLHTAPLRLYIRQVARNIRQQVQLIVQLTKKTTKQLLLFFYY